MDDAEFTSLVVAGIDALPEWVHTAMKNVVFVTADEPTQLQKRENNIGPDDVLFGLYEGIPLTARGIEYDAVLPDKITIFKNAILDAYKTKEEVKACVENTIWHEVAHHFGMEEDEVREEEQKRGKTL